MIVKLSNGKFRLMSHDGSKNLGTFDTEEEAKKHEQQVNYFKSRESDVKTYQMSCVGITEAYDSEKGIATVTIIKPGFNTSKQRYYPAETLKRDHKIFEGAKMFVNHQTEAEMKQRPEGSINDWVASLRNVRVSESGALVGDAHVIDPTFKSKLDLLQKQNMLSEMGISIRAVGNASTREVEGTRTNVVESFTKARSVDFVTFPGAGGRVEAIESESFDLVEEKGNTSMEELVKVKTDLAEANRKLDEANKEIEKLKGEKTALQTKIAESEKQAKIAAVQAEVVKQLGASKLPQPAKDRITKQFSASESCETLTQTIKDEEAYIKSVGGTGKVTNLGESDNNTTDNKPVEINWKGLGLSEAEVKAMKK